MNPFIKNTLKVFGLFGVLIIVSCQKEATPLDSQEADMKLVSLETAAAESASLMPEDVLNLSSTPSADELNTASSFKTLSKKGHKRNVAVYGYIVTTSLGKDKGHTLEPYGIVKATLWDKHKCYQTGYLSQNNAHNPYYLKVNEGEDLKCVKFSDDFNGKYLKLSGSLHESDSNKDDSYCYDKPEHLGEKYDCLTLDCKPGFYTVWQSYEKYGQKVYVKYKVYVD
jgi:hypothetical protein